MIAWNSQMALDAGQYLFFKESPPQQFWKVTNSEGKTFILKLYQVEEEMNSVRAGQYIESQLISDDEEFDPSQPEAGSEWAYIESSIEQILNHYPEVEKIEATSTND